MAGFVRRKKPILSLEALNIDTSDIQIKGTRTYGYWPSRKKKQPIVIDEVGVADLIEYKPKEKTGPKWGYKMSRRAPPVITKQAKPKPLSRPKGRPRLIRGPVLVRKKRPPKLEKPGREARAYQPSPEEIQRVADVMKELNRRRVNAIMDTREEEP